MICQAVTNQKILDQNRTRGKFFFNYFSWNFYLQNPFSSGYDSGPTTVRKPTMGSSFNFRKAQLHVQQQQAVATQEAASTYSPSTDSESEMIPPTPRKKLPAGAVAMPHMIQLWIEWSDVMMTSFQCGFDARIANHCKFVKCTFCIFEKSVYITWYEN